METVGIIAQIGASLWILNVWILRFNKETEYRGGDAKNMREEFQTYGFPSWAMYLIGGTKLSLAVLLLVGIWSKVWFGLQQLALQSSWREQSVCIYVSVTA